MNAMRLLPLVALLFTMTACGDGRWAPGYLITDDGQTLSNTDENKRALTIHTMVSQLDKDVGPHWRTEIAIAELPRYESVSDDGRGGGWMWSTATVAVTLVGEGAGEPKISEAQITKAISDYLYPQVEKPHRNLHITTTRVIDAARYAAKPVTATVEKPATTPVTGAQRYIVQAGDTWAELSQAFYGSPQHWRRLSDANHGGDLTAGREIVIPPKP